MAKLYFRYGSMASGKSNEIIGIETNYRVQGKKALVLSPCTDTRALSMKGFVSSRNGASVPCTRFSPLDNLTDIVRREHLNSRLSCVLVDEAQFLVREQVMQLTDIVDGMDIPVIAFGLKGDFRNNLFDGSYHLLAWADSIEEVKTVCWYCDRKATMNMRIGTDGRGVTDGAQVVIEGDGEARYRPVCRKCYKERIKAQPEKTVR